MRIVIGTRVADDPGAHPWLDRILHLIEDGWHVWDLSPAPDTPSPEAIENTRLCRDPGRQGMRVRELLVAATRRSAWTLDPHTRGLRITSDPTAEDDLAPEEAFRLAREPLVILVENQINDREFIERVVKEMDPALYGVWRLGGKPIRFDSLGGTGQMAQQVSRRVSAVPYRPRLVAVVDSDRAYPGDRASPSARKLRTICDDHDLPCWVLAKREAENYLPGVLLAAKPGATAEHAKRVEAWERLTDDQKDFISMKRGLQRASPSACEHLFNDLTPADRDILTSGLDKDVHKCWSVRGVPDVEDALRERGRGDLERGIALIRQEL